MTQATQAGQKVKEAFQQFGSMINFVLLIVAFISGVMLLGSWRTTVETGLESGKIWQNNHDAYHRERLAETKEIQGAVNARLSKNDDIQQQDARKLDSLEQRVTTMEKAVTTVEQNAAMQNRTLNEINGNLQVVKEILNRVEKKQGGN